MRSDIFGHWNIGVVASVIAMALAWSAPGAAHGPTPHAEEAPAAEAAPGADGGADGHAPVELRLAQPAMNAERGRELFVNKGCVACHAVNGVGGQDATPLDAHTMDMEMNPFDLAAKMWAMAPYMIAAQEKALGYQILFTGEELGDIVAFLHNDSEQHLLTEAALTAEVRHMMDHEHGTPGGPAEHAEEIGHTEMMQGHTGAD